MRILVIFQFLAREADEKPKKKKEKGHNLYIGCLKRRTAGVGVKQT